MPTEIHIMPISMWFKDMKDHFHNMHKEQMKAIEQKFQETVENRRKQQHDHNILIEKMKQEQEQQSLKCEEETQKVMQVPKYCHFYSVSSAKETYHYIGFRCFMGLA